METLAICAALIGGGVQLVQVGQQSATVRRVAVTGDDHGLDVRITASKPVTPRTQFVTDPDRLVVDLPEARPDARLQKIPIHRGKLRDVRVGLLSANPPVTRVVLDLVEPPEFRVLPLVNTVVVRLGNGAVAEPASEPVPIVPTNNPGAAVRPAETTYLVEVPPLQQRSQRSWAHWIMPILVTTTVMAMLVIAVVAHLQNRRSGRGL